MGKQGVILRVMIASPGDVTDARGTVEEVLHTWNARSAWTRRIVLLPWRWETSAVPSLNTSPQGVINAQGLDQADIVIALFGGRLGSPTESALSGTVEEIERAQQAGKPVHVYFSQQPLPPDVDTVQLDALRQWKNELTNLGLYGTYTTLAQLREQVLLAVEHDIQSVEESESALEQAGRRGAEFRVQPRTDREPRGLSKSGVLQYKTRRWIEVENVGSEDAEEVHFSVPCDKSTLHIFGTPPSTIHQGQTRNVTVARTAPSPVDDIIRITWQDSGGEHEADFHV
jgi:hypothetical protein